MTRLAFFEQRTFAGSASDTWNELPAAALVLGVVARELRDMPAPPSEVAAARQAVARVSDLRAHVRLRDLLGDVTHRNDRDESWRVPIALDLMAYAEQLRADGRLEAAADVFELAGERLECPAALRCEAGLRAAFCLRLLGQHDGAAAEYERVRAVAFDAGEIRLRLEAELGLAKVAIHRGNIPQAAPLVDAVIRAARDLDESSVLGKALIDRAAIAGIRREPLDVIRYSLAALEFIETPAGCDRTFVNMATAFRELGRATAAKRLARYVLSRRCDADQRGAALILLCHLAVDIGDHRSAASYERQLAEMLLTPALSAEYLEAVARDTAAQGRWTDAARALARMIAIADKHQLAELSFRAESALNAVAARSIPAVYEFQPQRPTNTEHTIATFETQVDALCSASAV